MYHYFEALTNTSGDSLIGYFARVIDRVTQQAVPIYADESGTPIISVSGFVNMAKTDDYGNIDLYVEPGTYNLDIYAPDGMTFRFRVNNVAMNSTKGDTGGIGPTGAAANNFGFVAEIQALNPAQFPTAILASTIGSDAGYVNGPFTYQAGDFTGRADVIQALGVPISSGAYVRQAASSVANGASSVSDQIQRNLRMYAGYNNSDVTAVIQQMIDDGGGHIPWRFAPYVLSSQIDLYGRVTVDPSAEFQWVGPVSDPQDIYNQIGMFVPRDGAELSCAGSSGASATFFCATDQHTVYIVLGRKVQNCRFNGLYGKSCNHVAVTAATDVYANVVSPDMVGLPKPGGGVYVAEEINTSSNITISGGGCEFENADALTGAGTSVRFTYGALIENLTWTRARNGLVVLGGNADTTFDGALSNRRKCSDIEVRSSRCFNSTGGAFVYLMTDSTNTWDCTARDNLDVGFDAEGCTDTRFYSCYAKNNVGGNFTVFYLTTRVSFNGCTSISDTKEALLFSVYNVGQTSENRDVSWIGGSMSCTDPTGPGSAGTMNGPIRSIVVRGCSFENVVLDMDRANNNQIDVTECTFRITLPFPAPFVVVKIGGLTQASPLSYARARIEGCVIHSEGVQPDGCVGISAMIGEFNSSPNVLVRGNRITIPLTSGWGGVEFVSNSPNPGLAPSFRAVDNGLTGGAITTRTNIGTTTGNFFGLDNYDIDSNNPVNLTPL